MLVQAGEREGRVFVVISGSIEILRVGLTGEDRLTLHEAGEFTGEMSALRGARSLVRARMLEEGEVLVVDHDSLRKLVQTDANLSELFMRAFILRRMGLIEGEGSDVILIGSRHSGGTLRLQQFLGRNGQPYHNVDIDTDPSVEEILNRFHVKVDEIPVVVCGVDQVLKNPSNQQIAECLQLNPQIDDSVVRDLLVIGAGPAGLAPQCTPLPRGSMCSSWKQPRLAAKPDRVRELRITWAFRPVYPGARLLAAPLRRRRSSAPTSQSPTLPCACAATGDPLRSNFHRSHHPRPRGHHRNWRGVSPARRCRTSNNSSATACTTRRPT